MAKFKTSKSKKPNPTVKPKKLPSNSRSIPERLNSDEIVFMVGTVAVLLAMLVVSLDMYSALTKQKNISAEREKIVREIAVWESELKDKPNYRDGYMSLAILNFRLRDMNLSRENLNEALRIDPNFEKGRELERILDSY